MSDQNQKMSRAAKSEAAANSASESTGETPPLPAAAATGPDISAVLSRLDAMQGQIESLTRDNESLARHNRELLERVASRVAPAVPAGTTVAIIQEDQVAKLEQRLAKLEREQDLKREALEQGREKFQVSMAGEPRMTRIVGSDGGPTVAKAKYEEYFGITAILDPQKQIQVKPLSAAA